MEKIIYKPIDTDEKKKAYSALAEWCNSNNHVIIDKPDYFEAFPIPLPSLEDAKEEKNHENDQKAELAREGQAFTVEIDGTELSFLTDRKTQQDLQTALTFLQAGMQTYKWIDEQGVSFDFTTPAQIIHVSTVFIEKANVYPKWQHFKQMIDAATTVEEVQAIVIDYGINL